ncbi:MAG: hypothetical protein JO211_02455 [Acidobacteriaceae bacterium]|nr:hypothetical protein [Acidobacteriaceae bacterium]
MTSAHATQRNSERFDSRALFWLRVHRGNDCSGMVDATAALNEGELLRGCASSALFVIRMLAGSLPVVPDGGTRERRQR